MNPDEIQKKAEEIARKAFNSMKHDTMTDNQKKYVQMTDDLLCQYQSRKAFLATAMKPEDYSNMPVDLAKKYTRKVENARFLTAVVEDALEGIKEKEHREVIDLIYFQHKTIIQIMEQLFCCNNTVLRWKKKALLDMAICIFGVDAVGLEEVWLIR